MTKKKFNADQTHGYIGEGTTYKKKIVPFVESPIITNYIAKRDEIMREPFDWTLPPVDDRPKLTMEELKAGLFDNKSEQSQIDFGVFGAKSHTNAKVLTEAEDKEAKQSSESMLQQKICAWILQNWPDTIFVSDFAAGIKLSPYLAMVRKNQSCNYKYPDLTISLAKGGFFGLHIEIKTLKGTPYLVDGKTLKKDKHIEAQQKTIDKLKSEGYAACFGVGEDHIKRIIMRYMGFERTVVKK